MKRASLNLTQKPWRLSLLFLSLVPWGLGYLAMHWSFSDDALWFGLALPLMGLGSIIQFAGTGQTVRIGPGTINRAPIESEDQLLLVAWPDGGIELRVNPELPALRTWPRDQLDRARKTAQQASELLDREVHECLVEPGGDGRIADRFVARHVCLRLTGFMAREHPELAGLPAAPPPDIQGDLDALKVSFGNVDIALDGRVVSVTSGRFSASALPRSSVGWHYRSTLALLGRLFEGRVSVGRRGPPSLDSAPGCHVPVEEVVGAVVLVTGGEHTDTARAKLELVSVRGRRTLADLPVPARRTSSVRRRVLSELQWVVEQIERSVQGHPGGERADVPEALARLRAETLLTETTGRPAPP